MPTRARGQYDHTHRTARARWAPIVDAGHAVCAEPRCLMRSRAIQPGTAWDLAHDREHGGYRGPAHARCNRSEGATHGNRQRRPRLPAW